MSFIVRGVIMPYIGDQMNILVQNADEQERFWKQEQIATDRGWAGLHPPKVTVSKTFASQCTSGDEVEYVIESVDRQTKDGLKRGIRGISIRTIKHLGE